MTDRILAIYLPTCALSTTTDSEIGWRGWSGVRWGAVRWGEVGWGEVGWGGWGVVEWGGVRWGEVM